ncbi:MAG: hypothetical protein K0R80_3221 [Clostridia bacterium]|nr:hypothetical protein [Clostridia bacterium]
MKRMLAIIICLVLVLTATAPVFANDNGFNERGYNYKARVYNGFYTEDLYLVMKWSKDWAPMANEPDGAWCTNHFTWYSNDYSVDTWYGYETLTTYGEGTYRIEEFSKIMKVSDDLEKWEEYQAAGAFDAGWGNYENEVPMYVVFQDSVNVFDTETGALVYSTTLVEGVNKGLGKPIF